MKKIIGKTSIEITHPDKLLLGAVSKLEIVDYYNSIAPSMLTYVKDRPLMMLRYPDGLKGESFYQKDISPYFPDWIKRVEVPKAGGINTFVVCQNQATLVYLANQACITPHLWLSKTDNLERPDRIIFDLDPSSDDFDTVRKIALALKEVFDALGLVSFVMTSGSRGLHIYLPIKRLYSFQQTRAFAQNCAEIIVHDHPHLATLELRKDKRGTRVFIDTLRNAYGATSVAPYAIRAYEKAPVATPLDWKEVESADLTAQDWTIKTVFDKIKNNDPWQDLIKVHQSLNKALLELKKLGL